METSDWIATIALGVSVLGFVATIWATRISSQALRLAEIADARSLRHGAHQLRADILIQIAEALRTMNKTRMEIGALQAGFAVEKQPVRVLLSKYDATLFADYLPRIEHSISQLNNLWAEVMSWGPEKSHAELLDMKALLHRTQIEDEQACQAAEHMMTEFRISLRAARQYADGATR